MQTIPVPLRHLQDRALAWAADQPDIRAVVRVGSYARRAHPGRACEHLALYDDGYKLDFAFFELDRLADMVARQMLDEVYARGGCAMAT